MWEETQEPGGNPHKHRENKQIPDKKVPKVRIECPGLWCSEAAALPTAPYATSALEQAATKVRIKHLSCVVRQELYHCPLH